MTKKRSIDSIFQTNKILQFNIFLFIWKFKFLDPSKEAKPKAVIISNHILITNNDVIMKSGNKLNSLSNLSIVWTINDTEIGAFTYFWFATTEPHPNFWFKNINKGSVYFFLFLALARALSYSYTNPGLGALRTFIKPKNSLPLFLIFYKYKGQEGCNQGMYTIKNMIMSFTFTIISNQKKSMRRIFSDRKIQWWRQVSWRIQVLVPGLAVQTGSAKWPHNPKPGLAKFYSCMPATVCPKLWWSEKIFFLNLLLLYQGGKGNGKQIRKLIFSEYLEWV